MRPPIQGKEEMQGFLYRVWKEIFAVVSLAELQHWAALSHAPVLFSRCEIEAKLGSSGPALRGQTHLLSP